MNIFGPYDLQIDSRCRGWVNYENVLFQPTIPVKFKKEDIVTDLQRVVDEYFQCETCKETIKGIINYSDHLQAHEF